MCGREVYGGGWEVSGREVGLWKKFACDGWKGRAHTHSHTLLVSVCVCVCDVKK